MQQLRTFSRSCWFTRTPKPGVERSQNFNWWPSLGFKLRTVMSVKWERGIKVSKSLGNDAGSRGDR